MTQKGVEVKGELLRGRKFLIFRTIVPEEIFENFKAEMSDSEKSFRLQEAIAFFFGCRLEKITIMKEDEI